MPSRDPPNNNDELDDDDEDGSKAEDGDYDDVRGFDEARDLGLTTSKPSPNRSPPKGPNGLPAIPPQAVIGGAQASGPARASTKKRGGAMNTSDLDSQQVLSEVGRIVGFPWPAAAGKRPPRDMKRLSEEDWYIVCKVMKWGDTPALFLRAFSSPEDDFGFYKPPVQYYEYQFQVGDRLQLSQTGYSASRNKIATSIRVRPTHMYPVPEDKINWVPPPVTDAMLGSASSDPKARAKKDKPMMDAPKSMPEAAGPKRKKIKEEEPAPMMHHRMLMNDYVLQNFAQSSSPMTLQKKTLGPGGPSNDNKMKPAFSFFGQAQQQNFGAGTGPMGQSQLFFPGTPDLQRVPSLSAFPSFSMPLMPPSSPNLLGSASPLLGGPGQPTMHRISSVGVGGFPSLFSMSSPNTNGPQFQFPSMSNMTTGMSGEPSNSN